MTLGAVHVVVMRSRICAYLQENKRKEAKILEDMRRLVDSTLGPSVGGPGDFATMTEGGGA
jgi:hypothetical protein